MSFFNSNHYSQTAHYIPLVDIKRLVSPMRLHTLTDAEALQTEEAIANAQHYNNGKISLYKIYEILQKLAAEHQLSGKIDREQIMKVFVAYFNEHYFKS